jgi:hypothetical protein
MKTFLEFLFEGYAKGAGSAKSSKSHSIRTSDRPTAAGINHADSTLDGLRSHLLDIFWPKANGDKEKEVTINQCITTFVHAMDKKLRIDEDIIQRLAKCVDMPQEKVTQILGKELDKYYSQFQNLYGMK